MTSKAPAIKEKLDFIKIENLCFKEYNQENEDNSHNERKYLHIIFLIRV